MAYCTLAEVKDALNITDTGADALLNAAIATATSAIDGWCGRSFADSGAASARKFQPSDRYCLRVDDFSTTTGLIIATDTNNDGTYETTWAASDYELDPANGIVDGISGWPYTGIYAVGSNLFPLPYLLRRFTVQVTARWGWAAVPEPVRESCKQVAIEEFRRKDAPFGVIQTVDFGPMRLAGDTVRAVTAKLSPYRDTYNTVPVG